MPFIKLDYEMLKSKAFRDFVGTPLFLTWMILRMNIFRPHPEMHLNRTTQGWANLYQEGWLACHLSVAEIAAAWGGDRNARTIARDLEQLEAMHLLERYANPHTGKMFYRVGMWGVEQRGNSEVRWEQTFGEMIFTEPIGTARPPDSTEWEPTPEQVEMHQEIWGRINTEQRNR